MARTTGPEVIVNRNAWALLTVILLAGGLLAALAGAVPGLKLPATASLIVAGIALVSIGGVKFFRAQ